MKYQNTMVFVLLVFLPALAFAYSFIDNFNDNDISDWENRCASGSWYAQNEMVHGNTNNSPAILAPVSGSQILNGTISASCTGVHSFGIAARLTSGDTGIVAYVSPDNGVARIRQVVNGQLGTSLNSISGEFPSGVDYTLTLTCDETSLQFDIYIPSSGASWTFTASDPNVTEGKFGLMMGDEPGATWDWIEVNGTAALDIDMTWFTTEDITGNGNMCLEQTETIDLGIELSNLADETMSGVFGVLQSLSPDLTVTQNQVTYGNMAGLSSSYGSGSFGVMAPAITPDGVYNLRLTLFADGGYQKQINFPMPVGCGLESSFETVSEGWTSGAVSAGWSSDWHISTERNHTSSGSKSFKCGSTGTGDYSNHQYAYLQSPYINVPLNEAAEFWSWMDAQEESSTLAFDGSILQYKRMGEWITVATVPAYSHQIASGSTGPFPDGTPVHSGEHSWTKFQFSVPEIYAGPGMYRFIFGSDDTGNREGWHIDDFSIVDLSTAVEDQEEAVPGQFLRVLENPFTNSVTFSYQLAGTSGTSLEIFDLTGRSVENIPVIESVQPGHLIWNTSAIPSGVYFARITDSELKPVRLVKF